jgi:hypothetical protein
MANYTGKWKPKRMWTVKTINTPATAAGMSVGDVLEITGVGDGTTNSKLKRGNPDPTIEWGDKCKPDPHPDVEMISLFVGGQEYTITREVVIRLICRPKSGSASWTAEEGGP